MLIISGSSIGLILMLVVSSIGLNGSISVRALEGPKTGILPTLRSAKSPESYTVLDVDQNAYLFVGGMLGSVKVREIANIANITQSNNPTHPVFRILSGKYMQIIADLIIL